MQMLNRYFTPFALILISSAVYFRIDDFRENFSKAGLRALSAPMIAIGILLADLLVNWWLSRNLYRWAAWAPRMRQAQIWLNYVWAVPLFYLLYPYWAPMWLLFVTAPTAAALTTSQTETVVCSVVAAGTMIAIYWSTQGYHLTPESFGNAMSQASFIVIFALLVHSLAQNALRMRDHNLS